MEQAITQRLHIWFTDLLDETEDVLSFGGDMSILVEMEPGVVLRMN